MILTGPEIVREVHAGRIMIMPFDPRLIEPNSYGFHLGNRLIVYDDRIVDSFAGKRTRQIILPENGFVMRRGRFYLGQTLEHMGSTHYASELYARMSTSTVGLFIQTSAPLGHTGAIIPWTLELMPTHNVRVYRGMLLGKICFWSNKGEIEHYRGRYRNSRTVVSSLLSGSEP